MTHINLEDCILKTFFQSKDTWKSSVCVPNLMKISWFFLLLHLQGRIFTPCAREDLHFICRGGSLLDLQGRFLAHLQGRIFAREDPSEGRIFISFAGKVLSPSARDIVNIFWSLWTRQHVYKRLNICIIEFILSFLPFCSVLVSQHLWVI